MDIILYYSNSVGEEIEHAIKAGVPDTPVRTCRTISQLHTTLRSSFTLSHVIVLAPHDRKDLSNILIMVDWLVDFPLILVLPDSEKETVSNGLRLRPRFFTHVDGNFKQMVAILARVLENEKKKQCKWTEAYSAQIGAAK